ncbi:MAG: ABC transporter ATP-binding protein [Clostridia bacterium]|nr:ABC transporter ATP-binding protein [Clostridia bacterium]
MKKPLIKVKDLKVSFYNNNKAVEVIRGFDIDVWEGEIVGILGESGSGKTVSSTSILHMMEKNEGIITSGEILYNKKDLATLSEKQMNTIRGRKIAYVFQNPAQALSPYKKIGRQFKNLLKNHNLKYSSAAVQSALEEVGIKDAETVLNMYPFQLSGGQNQRIMIALSIITKPDLLIADEPTSSIDTSLIKKVLDLFRDINKKYNMSMIIITHDFNVAKYICNRLVIMYGGLVVETGDINSILNNPLHPYTEELIKCAYSLDNYKDSLYSLEGAPPTPYEFKDECPFYSRCKIREDECRQAIPYMKEIEGRQVRCLKR